MHLTTWEEAGAATSLITPLTNRCQLIANHPTFSAFVLQRLSFCSTARSDLVVNTVLYSQLVCEVDSKLLGIFSTSAFGAIWHMTPSGWWPEANTPFSKLALNGIFVHSKFNLLYGRRCSTKQFHGANLVWPHGTAHHHAVVLRADSHTLSSAAVTVIVL